MTNKGPSVQSDLEHRLAVARELYWELSAELRDSIQRLRSGTEAPDDMKYRQNILRQHLAQLQMVLDLEGKLDTYNELTGKAGLNLAKARAEIGERLARLRASGSGGCVPG